jgi:hypothetical protein
MIQVPISAMMPYGHQSQLPTMMLGWFFKGCGWDPWSKQVPFGRIFGQQWLHPRHQIWDPERLRHHSVHASFHRNVNLFASGICGDSDDGNMAENVATSFVFSDLSYAGQTIHYWHLWDSQYLYARYEMNDERLTSRSMRMIESGMFSEFDVNTVFW